ncbi:MAG: hypothetical protein ACP5VE_14550 [Chthonomonadales bacterium]
MPYVAPSGKWVLLMDSQTGRLLLQALPDGKRRRLPNKWRVRCLWGAPWSRDGDTFFLVVPGDGRPIGPRLPGDDVLAIRPGDLTSARIGLRGIVVVGSVVPSPNNRMLAATVMGDRDVSSGLMIVPLTRRAERTTTTNGYRVAFRHDVEAIAWIRPELMAVLTGGFDLAKIGAPQFRRKMLDPQMWRWGVFLLDAISGRSRPLILPGSQRLSALAPYSDSTGALIALAHDRTRTTVYRLDLRNEGWADVGELHGAQKWFIAYANPDRIYFWSYAGAGRRAVQVATYRPSQRMLEPPRPISVRGPISTDRAGRIYWWDGSRVMRRSPIG